MHLSEKNTIRWIDYLTKVVKEGKTELVVIYTSREIEQKLLQTLLNLSKNKIEIALYGGKKRSELQESSENLTEKSQKINLPGRRAIKTTKTSDVIIGKIKGKHTYKYSKKFAG